ncbi:MAG: heavy metal translocating P-type ATPase [Schaedlerella sp.]|nr:cadmium-translocating P-type ATPase [Lachnospiraceae bacterium]MDY4203387.1 heavy metal translocating P-type ATPase [Schaedlerella sp.]
MAKEVKRKLAVMGVGAAAYIAAIMLTRSGRMTGGVEMAVFLPAFLLLAAEVVWQTTEAIGRGMFDGGLKNLKTLGNKLWSYSDSILILIASAGAMIVGYYKEAVGAILFFQLGKLAEVFSVSKTKKAIAQYIDIRPEHAHVKLGGNVIDVEPGYLEPRQIIVIKPGEKIPVDAVVTQGSGLVDMKALTGESVPKEVRIGDRLYGGTINQNSMLEARVSKVFEESTASRIVKLVESVGERKSETEKFADKFIRVYTPVVTLMGILVMLLPPMMAAGQDPDTWIYRGLIFLVAACPFGLLVSVPLAFLGGIGAATRQGILIKGSNYLEALAKTDTFVFDKTGTLTEGFFKVQEICPRGMKARELLDLMAHAEAFSTHPIAVSLRKSYGRKLDMQRVTGIEESSGFGVKATVDGRKVLVGSDRYLNQEGIFCKKIPGPGTQVHVAVDDSYAGYALIADVLRADAKQTVQWMSRHQIETVILTGDNEEAAESTARQLGITHVYANLMPENKVDLLEEFMGGEMEGEKLAFVGDGINDAPVLARADVGIAMGGLGADAALEAADIVLMEDEPYKIVRAIRISRETIRSVNQNFVFAMMMKVLLLILAFVGLISMRRAIVADIGVMLLGILNSFWILYI